MSDFKLDNTHLERLLESARYVLYTTRALSVINPDSQSWLDTSSKLCKAYEELSTLLNDGNKFSHFVSLFPRLSVTSLRLSLNNSAVEELFEIAYLAVEGILSYGPEADIPSFDENELFGRVVDVITAGWVHEDDKSLPDARLDRLEAVLAELVSKSEEGDGSLKGVAFESLKKDRPKKARPGSSNSKLWKIWFEYEQNVYLLCDGDERTPEKCWSKFGPDIIKAGVESKSEFMKLYKCVKQKREKEKRKIMEKETNK